MGLFLLSCMVELLEATVITMFLISLVLLARVESVQPADDIVCESGEYKLNQTTCVPCTVCPQDYGVQYECQDSTDTVCSRCTNRQYTKLTSINRFCTNCSNCTVLKRQLLLDCTTAEDTICGSCEQDHFLQIDRNGNTQCVRCSLCPPDSSAVRWFECSHLPATQQCAPGYTVQTVAATTEMVPTAHIVPNLLPELVRLTRNRTVYFSVGISPAAIKSVPVFEIIVSLISIIFTLITVSVFMCVSISICRKKCCKRN